MNKKAQDPYKYTFEELQEKYGGNELFDGLLDILLATNQTIKILRLGEIFIIQKDEKKELIKNFCDFLEKAHFKLNNVVTEKELSLMLIKKIDQLKKKLEF